jgi:hypothetical protein
MELQRFNLQFQFSVGISSQALLLLFGLSRVFGLVDVKLLLGHPVKSLTKRLLTTVSFAWVSSLKRC